MCIIYSGLCSVPKIAYFNTIHYTQTDISTTTIWSIKSKTFRMIPVMSYIRMSISLKWVYIICSKNPKTNISDMTSQKTFLLW